MGACRSRQERPCDGCVSGSAGNLQLRRRHRRHDQGSHWLPSKPIRAECCSNKLFIIIPDGEEAAQSRGGPINGRAAARRPPNAGTGRSSLPRWSNTVPPSFRATPGSRPPPRPLPPPSNGNGTRILERRSNYFSDGPCRRTLREVKGNAFVRRE